MCYGPWEDQQISMEMVWLAKDFSAVQYQTINWHLRQQERSHVASENPNAAALKFILGYFPGKTKWKEQ